MEVQAKQVEIKRINTHHPVDFADGNSLGTIHYTEKRRRLY
jgi:hypothetical protein